MEGHIAGRTTKAERWRKKGYVAEMTGSFQTDVRQNAVPKRPVANWNAERA